MLYFEYDGSRYGTHGCEDYELWQSNDGITAVCIASSSCHNCWQVGHDNDHFMSEVGETALVENLIKWGYEETKWKKVC